MNIRFLPNYTSARKLCFNCHRSNDKWQSIQGYLVIETRILARRSLPQQVPYSLFEQIEDVHLSKEQKKRICNFFVTKRLQIRQN